MVKHLSIISLMLFAFISLNAQAKLNTTDKEYITNLKSGNLKKIKRTAKLMIRNQTKNERVLDVATEVLLQAATTITREEVHTYTHLARAIGESLNGRYYSALKQVKETTNSKHVRKWAKKGYKMIGKGNAKEKAQYKQGMVKL